jgi:hypothetical protein
MANFFQLQKYLSFDLLKCSLQFKKVIIDQLVHAA